MTLDLTELDEPLMPSQALSPGVMLDSDGTILHSTGDEELIEISHLLDGKWNRYVGVKVIDDDAGTFISRHGESLKSMATGRRQFVSAPSKREETRSWEETTESEHKSLEKSFWRMSRTSLAVPSRAFDLVSDVVDESARVAPSEITADDLQLEKLLTDLADPSTELSDNILRNVLKLQFYKIPPDRLTDVCGALTAFVRHHRHSDRNEVLIAVTAAIRKLLLNLGQADLSIAAELLSTDGRLLIPIEIELEVAKILVRRLNQEPSLDSRRLESVGDLMIEAATLYSTPKMVLRDRYGATALNSLLAVVLMKHPGSEALWDDVSAHAPTWFADSVRGRLRRYHSALLKSNVEGAIELGTFICGHPILTTNG